MKTLHSITCVQNYKMQHGIKDTEYAGRHKKIFNNVVDKLIKQIFLNLWKV